MMAVMGDRINCTGEEGYDTLRRKECVRRLLEDADILLKRRIPSRCLLWYVWF